MKLIRGDDNDYKQWRIVIRENIKLENEIKHLETMLGYSNQSDQYRDEQIETLKELLVSKETLIAAMRERINA